MSVTFASKQGVNEVVDSLELICLLDWFFTSWFAEVGSRWQSILGMWKCLIKKWFALDNVEKQKILSFETVFCFAYLPVQVPRFSIRSHGLYILLKDKIWLLLMLITSLLLPFLNLDSTSHQLHPYPHHRVICSITFMFKEFWNTLCNLLISSHSGT